MTEISKITEKKMAKRLVEIVVHEMLAKGHITESDLNDQKSLFDKISELTKTADFKIIIDHRDSILLAAEEYLTKKQYDFSIIFFAMFFEHSINHLITHKLEKKKISKKAKTDLIRSANMEAKFSWLLELLEMPKFNDSHKKTIIKASNERNAFIHYKWKPLPDMLSSDEDEKSLELLSSVRKTVTYMKRYESRILYEKNKGKLKRVLNKKP